MGINCTVLKKVDKASLSKIIQNILKSKDLSVDSRFGDGSAGKRIAEQISKLPDTYRSKPKLTFENS